MNQDIKELWATALESGEYPQGQGLLHVVGQDGEPDKFCCLGVLCVLAMKAGTRIRTRVEHGFDAEFVEYDGTASYLPQSVMEWAGLHQAVPTVMFEAEQRWLDSLNDSGQASFHAIAAAIRASL